MVKNTLEHLGTKLYETFPYYSMQVQLYAEEVHLEHPVEILISPEAVTGVHEVLDAQLVDYLITHRDTQV